MEKILLKTGMYAFIFSFLLFFVGIDRVKSTTDINGMTSGVEIPYPDYFLMITRYSIMISLIAISFVFAVQRKKIRVDA
ncbi:hypothetical protein [Virgibacillus sp. Bac332]|uniref:hypothetical protein n=1 Tax=Virgibacillus sp. Bac332 TaxID=2419842 RepID=UPI000EF4927E|nr:hypothetical protein [Virgibacillus sp. Bac332]